MDTPKFKSPIIGSQKVGRRNLHGAIERAVGGGAAGAGLGSALAKASKSHVGARIGAAAGAIAGMAYHKPINLSVGAITGRALRRGVNVIRLSSRLKLIELRNPFDKFHDTDYTDINQVVGKNLAGRQNAYGGRSPVGFVLSNAEKGAKLAGDVVDAVRSRSLNHQNFVGERPRAQAGNFTITGESAHTARITTAPHARERRGKYEWEKVGTQRKLAVLAGGAITVGAALASRKILHASPDGKSFGKGIANIIGKVAHGAKEKTKGVGAVFTGRPYKPIPFVPRADNIGPNNAAQYSFVKTHQGGFIPKTQAKPRNTAKVQNMPGAANTKVKQPRTRKPRATAGAAPTT